jgi:hypothetical protein
MNMRGLIRRALIADASYIAIIRNVSLSVGYTHLCDRIRCLVMTTGDARLTYGDAITGIDAVLCVTASGEVLKCR